MIVPGWECHLCGRVLYGFVVQCHGISLIESFVVKTKAKSISLVKIFMQNDNHLEESHNEGSIDLPESVSEWSFMYEDSLMGQNFPEEAGSNHQELELFDGSDTQDSPMGKNNPDEAGSNHQELELFDGYDTQDSPMGKNNPNEANINVES